MRGQLLLPAFFAGDFLAAVVFFAPVDFFAGADFLAADVVFFAALVVFLAAVDVDVFAGDDFFAAVFLAVDFVAVVFRAADDVVLEAFFAAVDRVELLERDDELPPEELELPLTARAAALTGAVATRAAALAGAVAATAASFATEPAADPVDRAGALSFFAPLTTSLNCCPGRNFGTEVFLSFTCAPVAGLRAVRAARSTFSKTPKPEMATRSPLATARVMASVTASTASVAVLLSPTLSVMASMSWALFTRGSLR